MMQHNLSSPEQTRVKKTQYIHELKEKDSISSPFLVKYSSVKVGKTGKPYLSLILMDRTGEMEARIWEEVPQYATQAVQDAFLWVDGKCQSYQGRRQVIIKKAQVAVSYTHLTLPTSG